MPDRPTIGITTQTLEPAPNRLLPRCWVMSQRYVQVLAAAGGVPWVIPLSSLRPVGSSKTAIAPSSPPIRSAGQSDAIRSDESIHSIASVNC